LNNTKVIAIGDILIVNLDLTKYKKNISLY
jgi:hypothetical protein